METANHSRLCRKGVASLERLSDTRVPGHVLPQPNARLPRLSIANRFKRTTGWFVRPTHFLVRFVPAVQQIVGREARKRFQDAFKGEPNKVLQLISFVEEYPIIVMEKEER